MYMMGMGEKNPKYIQGENQGKNPPVWLPSHPPVYEKMEVDCFPVSKNTENKLDLP